MTTTPENTFNRWLDAFVAGRSTPTHDAPADPDMAGKRDAARRLHQLAELADADAAFTGRDDQQISTWNQFMSDHASALPAARTVSSRRRSHSRLGPLLTGFNIAMAAVIVIAIGAGFWRATNPSGGGNDDGDGNLALAPDTRTFEPEGTPETVADLPPVPTADECTVEPLSIDTVLWYFTDPAAALRSRLPETTVATAEIPQATPDNQGLHLDDPLIASPVANFEPGPASPDQLAAMASLQRMWMACVLANSPFQRWALESPALVATQVEALLPDFASEDDARAILKEVERTGVLEPSEDFRKRPGASFAVPRMEGFPAYMDVSVIETESAYTWTLDGRTFWSSYSTYHLQTGERRRDGDRSEIFLWTPVAGAPSAIPWIDGEGNCFWYGFTWYPDREQLLLSSYPVCG
jgi:hypothetical protein